MLRLSSFPYYGFGGPGTGIGSAIGISIIALKRADILKKSVFSELAAGFGPPYSVGEEAE
jgi:hypothetical protein